MGFDGIYPPIIKQGWLQNPGSEWRFLARNITDFYGPFSSTPCLMKPESGGYFDCKRSPQDQDLLAKKNGSGFIEGIGIATTIGIKNNEQKKEDILRIKDTYSPKRRTSYSQEARRDQGES